MFATGDNSVLDGEFNLANGVRFTLHSTAYGDGTYQDQQGRKYPVDAGLIGCIRAQDVYDPEWWLEGVQTIEFTEQFELQYDEGVIKFVGSNGKVLLSIDTDPVYDDYNEEEEEA